jgi:hypothetical protein
MRRHATDRVYDGVEESLDRLLRLLAVVDGLIGP